MSSQEDVDRIANIIVNIIKNIDFGRDLEKTLNVLTTARGLFINLDKVTEALVFQVLNLANIAHRIQRGKHNQKTQTFVKACIAYCHITIPTLEDASKQLQLFFLTAQVSLLNGLIGEAESLIKVVLATMDENFMKFCKEVTSSGQKIDQYGENLHKMGEMLQSVIGFLVILPSNPEQDFFQILMGILNFISKDEWGQSEVSYIVQIKVLDSCVRYLASQTQDTLPYRIPNVESNDQIFIGNDAFYNECNNLMDQCFEQILDIIQKLDAIKD